MWVVDHGLWYVGRGGNATVVSQRSFNYEIYGLHINFCRVSSIITHHKSMTFIVALQFSSKHAQGLWDHLKPQAKVEVPWRYFGVLYHVWLLWDVSYYLILIRSWTLQKEMNEGNKKKSKSNSIFFSWKTSSEGCRSRNPINCCQGSMSIVYSLGKTWRDILGCSEYMNVILPVYTFPLWRAMDIDTLINNVWFSAKFFCHLNAVGMVFSEKKVLIKSFLWNYVYSKKKTKQHIMRI